MTIYDQLINRESKLVVVGLGYVGLPIAIEFAKYVEVIGFDISKSKITSFKKGIDITQEVGNEVLHNSTIYFTDNEQYIREGSFIIVAVPTPIYSDKTPDLSLLRAACEVVGRNLTKNTIVVFESTVYPGVTEEICIPILENVSGLKVGRDFGVGYSPERINPGDREHRVHNIVKIVSGIDSDTLQEVAKTYELVVKAGVYKTSSIKVAEATKLAENAQRDINIAFMNELAVVFEKIGISTYEVVKAMNTKWNALKFTPGLVGGHCIGVDPYYFIYQASCMNYQSQIIGAGRKINDGMSQFVGEMIIKNMIKANKRINGAKVWILGLTFKENCPDIRNTKVVDIIEYLQEYGVEVVVTDPMADINEAMQEYGIKLVDSHEVDEVDCIVFAVAHQAFKKIAIELFKAYFKNEQDEEMVIIDIKNIINKEEAQECGYSYWGL
ncbi:nucleotide sugar dehydrogenase [Niameybacter massiliensis]|uniref:Nucleotide sugar dehydrogenase n=1 Tax=Holtiella tumoricola TaxID=3018743 RepID=A0AA42DMN1_9FIRM|nr:nucleotide sugar dehydrogenase [Holtiella tumoricola]MDA3731992.1 nucleotide sugar dehydrogenase [Holtiella tumoricola]